MSTAVANVRALVDEGGEADDVLRGVVDTLASSENVGWAGLAFVDDGSLNLGPQRGDPDEPRRERVPIAYEGAAVGELWVDGDVPRPELEEIAALIAPYVLIGWDTGGEAWEP